MQENNAIQIKKRRSSKNDKHQSKSKTQCRDIEEKVLQLENQLRDLTKYWKRVTGHTASELSMDQQRERNIQAACLCVAAENGDIETMQKMLQNGADIQQGTHDNRTPLLVAISSSQLRAVRWLIKNGADVLQPDKFGVTPMSEAMRAGNLDIVLDIEQAKKKISDSGEPLSRKSSAEEKQVIVEKAEINSNKKKRNSKAKNHTSLIRTHHSVGIKKISTLLERLRGYKVSDDREDETDWLTENKKFPKGSCLVCDCKQFRNVLEFECTCGHTANDHITLISSDEKILSELIETNLNKEILTKSQDINLSELQDILKEDKPNWITKYDNLKIITQIGEGTTAKVYKGIFQNEEYEDGIEVAIKVMEFSISKKDYQKQISDLKKELDILTNFKHPRVVALLGVVVDPKICLILDYCPGGSMYSFLIRDDFIMTWDMFFKWTKETILGLCALHFTDPPIVHRDVKTLNLLISDNMEVKVADFGLSRFISEQTILETLGKLRGTYCYTAPELYFGQNYTVKSDIYSLGIVFWELIYKTITKKYLTPFTEYDYITYDFQIIICSAKKNLRPTFPDNIPSPIQNLIEIIWRPKPEDRPDSRELLEILSELEKEYLSNRKEWNLCLLESIPIKSSLKISFPLLSMPLSVSAPPSNKAKDNTVTESETLTNKPSIKRRTLSVSNDEQRVYESINPVIKRRTTAESEQVSETISPVIKRRTISNPNSNQNKKNRRSSDPYVNHKTKVFIGLETLDT